MILRNNVLVDLDHTIFNSFWRDPMIGNVSWDEYHSQGKNDKPIPEMVEMLRALALAGFNNIGLTARPAKWCKQSVEQCVTHDIPLHEILMRPDDNYRIAPDLKMALAIERFTKDLLPQSVAFIMDDREDVIAAFKAIGITGLVVHARRE